MNASVKMIGLGSVSWMAEDVHKLLSCLSITKLDALIVSEKCQMSHGSSCSVITSRISVGTTDIKTSLRIDALQALLSQIDVHDLCIKEGAQVVDMDKYKPLKGQVNHYYHPSLNYIYIINNTRLMLF